MIERSWKIKFGKLKIGVTKKIIDFSNLIFQLHCIITPVILDLLACSLPKTIIKFHQLFKYVKKDAIFSSIRWENGRYIFGWCSLLGTVCLLPHYGMILRLFIVYIILVRFRVIFIHFLPCTSLVVLNFLLYSGMKKVLCSIHYENFFSYLF